MKETEEMVSPFKDIDNFPEYYDCMFDTLDWLVKELKENDMTREPDGNYPEHWDFVVTNKGMNVYDKVRDRLIEIAFEKFGKDDIYDLPDVLQYN